MGAVTHLPHRPRGDRDIADLVEDLVRAMAAQAPARPVDDGQLLTIAETAERLRVHRDTVSKLLDAGELPTTRVGRQRRVRVVDLVAYLDERRSP